MVSAISQARIVYIGRTPSRTNNSPLFEVVLKGSRWYVSWRGGRERETIDMGLDALQMRGMEQQAKPDGGYVSSTYAKGRGKYAGERLLLSMEARSRRGGPHSLFTRNTYLSTRGRLSLFRLFQRVLISPLLRQIPDFDPANTLLPRKFSTFVVLHCIFNISLRFLK